MLFEDIGQYVVRNQVGAVLRSNRGGDKIPPKIAQIVCNKYTWHINLTEKSFHCPKKSFQVNRVVVALGRHHTIPRIYPLVHGTSSTSKITTFIGQIEEPAARVSHKIAVVPQCTDETPQKTDVAEPFQTSLALKVLNLPMSCP